MAKQHNNQQDPKQDQQPSTPKQLQLEITIPPPIQYQTPDRIYQYPELLRHTYFLNSGSKTVTNSRKVYQQTLQNKPNQTPASLRKEDVIKTYDNGWSIIGSIEYGLPNELDGHVWDFFKKKLSITRLKEGKFYHLCFFTLEEILQDLIKTGVLTTRGGKQNQAINDSISRLFRTAYKYEKGLIVKTQNNNQEEQKQPQTTQLHSTEFNLITTVFRKGQLLPNGELCDTQMAVAINPIIIQSLEQDYYIITSNQRRELLTKYPSKVLYDLLGYWGYIKYKKNEFLSFQALQIQPFQVINYQTLCQTLGLEPLSENLYRESKIKIQLEKIHNELIDSGIIDWYMIEQHKKEGKKHYKIIYAYSNYFMNEITKFESEKTKLKYKHLTQQHETTPEEIDTVLKKINTQIKNKEIKGKLLKNFLNLDPE